MIFLFLDADIDSRDALTNSYTAVFLPCFELPPLRRST
jgi:hypothetical protein